MIKNNIKFFKRVVYETIKHCKRIVLISHKLVNNPKEMIKNKKKKKNKNLKKAWINSLMIKTNVKYYKKGV